MRSRVISLLGVTATLTLSPTSASAQVWYPWGGWSQPQYQQPYQPSQQQQRSVERRPKHKRSDQATSHERTKAVERASHGVRTIRTERAERVKPKKRTIGRERPVVYQEKTWKDLNQDDAREWIKEQVQTFCGKYPKDQACQQQKEP